jgi:MFS family permease
MVGTSIILFPTFFTLIIGRSIQGICVGLYSAIVPLFINEYAPLEIAGRLGAINQLMIVSGIVLTNVIALFVTNRVVPENPIISDFPIWSSWRIIFGLPLVIAVVQILLLLLVFKNETPRYLYTVGRDADAL